MSRRTTGRDRVAAARRRKLAVLGGLAVVFAAIWGRNALDLVPRGAQADADDAASDADAIDAPAVTRAPVRLEPPPPRLRDPFALDPSVYARRAVEGASPSEPAPADTDPVPAGPSRTEVERAAATLVLAATFLGEEPKALVNGRTLRVGESIDGFVVRSIGPRRIVVERDGIRIELEM